MFSLEILVAVGAVAAIIGALIGAIASRRLVPPEQQKELEQSLQLTRQELNKYQQDVAHHFAETSRLVNNLTQNYKDVHEHLAKGAVQLTNAEISKSFISGGDTALGIEVGEAINEVQPEPPRDWAPKTPGEAGMLSEEYGLSDEKTEDILDESFPKAQSKAI
ncbi:hypothetical protein SAMN02745866_03231 [Alteromonadaceae bacterium Bs31]|nr:hypothetical protein SAMN02745866_03231 [Alteromonadaceae bacterium Bs31]